MDTQNIISVYQQIDDEVKQLHELSNKDFNKLNSLFKENHSKSSNFYKTLIAILEEIKQFLPEALTGATTIEREFINFRQQTTQLYSNLSMRLNKLRKFYDTIKVPIKNYKQNLLTIKFIISNIQLLENRTIDNTKTLHKQILETFVKIEQLFDRFSSVFDELDTHIDNTIKTIHVSQEQVNEQYSDYEIQIRQLSEGLKKKLDEIDDYSFKIDYEQTIQEYSNEVIINLQYHDIIRQKMDHVQDTYKNFIITSTDKLEKEDAKSENSFLGYIINLADLQSAQLTHVNKKYQDAIRSICNGLNRLADLVDTYLNEFKKEILVKNKNSIVHHFQVQFAQNNPAGFKTTELVKKLNHLAEELVGYWNNTKDVYHSIKQENITLIKLIKELVFQKDTKGLLDDSLYVQLINLSNETTRLSKEITGSLTKTDSLVQDFNPRFSIDKIMQTAIDFEHKYQQKSRLYDEANKTTSTKLQQIEELSEQIKRSYKNKDSDLNYYAYFETTIQKIIANLTDVHEKVSKGSSISQSELLAELNKLKELYTMDSERIIHDHIASSHSSQIITDIEEEDGSQVEFF